MKFPSLVCEICRPPPAVTSTFDLISMSRPRHIRDVILQTLAQIFTKILHSSGFSGHCLLWPWSLTPKA